MHTCTHQGCCVCHIGQLPWVTFTLQSLIHIDNSVALEHGHYFALVSCHILLQSSRPRCPNPVQYLREDNGSVQFCGSPVEKNHFFHFSEGCRCVCQWGSLMIHLLLFFVGLRLRRHYVANEDQCCCLNICNLCIILKELLIIPFVWLFSFIRSPSRSQPHYVIKRCQTFRKKYNQTGQSPGDHD